MVPTFLKKLLLYSTAHTYSNLSRLFLRLFAGIMFMQFGIRQWTHFDSISTDMVGVLGMSGETTLILLIVIEIVCSALIMIGLFSRLAALPPLVTMIVAETVVLSGVETGSAMLLNSQPYVPILFIGIFVYMLLAGPGKVSLDYLISVKLLGWDKQAQDELEKA